MTDTYTDYYALCVDGILSYPYSVGPGVQCYNGEPVASSWTQHYLTGLAIGLGVVAVIGGGYALIRRKRHA